MTPAGSKPCRTIRTPSTKSRAQPEAFGDFGDVGAQVAGLVDRVDQHPGHHVLGGRQAGHGQLLGKVLDQGGGRDGALVRCRRSRSTAAARARPVDLAAGLFGPGVGALEPGPSPVARSPGETSSGVASIWWLAALSDTESRPRFSVARSAGSSAAAFGLDGTVFALEQGIAFELGLDEGVEFEVRQLQELDRLLELRRDGKALALPKLQSVAESQCALLGKSTYLLIAIERPVWLTGRERQQKRATATIRPSRAAFSSPIGVKPLKR